MDHLNPVLVEQLSHRLTRLELEAGDHREGRDLHAYNARLRTARLALARAKGRHTAAEWEAILVETDGICVRCHTRPHRICKGYVTPLAAGGSDTIDNLQPLCPSCVSAKQAEQINWLERWRETKTGT